MLFAWQRTRQHTFPRGFLRHAGSRPLTDPDHHAAADAEADPRRSDVAHLDTIGEDRLFPVQALEHRVLCISVRANATYDGVGDLGWLGLVGLVALVGRVIREGGVH